MIYNEKKYRTEMRPHAYLVEQTVEGEQHVSLIWFVFFCYSVVAALLVQKAFLPRLPAIHSGNGLLQGDAAVFHELAAKISTSITENGWQELWRNIGKQPFHLLLLGAMYAFFVQDPALMVPINAAFHALGGVLIYLLGMEIWRGGVGKKGGLIAATWFVLSPSTLVWYGQLHKDSFAIVGILLIFLSWLRLSANREGAKHGVRNLAAIVVGTLLILSVRPYFITLIFTCGIVLVCLLFMSFFLFHDYRRYRQLLFYGMISLIVLFTGAKMSHHLADGTNFHDGTKYQNWSVKGDWQWTRSHWLPASIDAYVEIASRTRVGLIYHNIISKAGSSIDIQYKPSNVKEVIAYLPRALQIGLFAPFPSSWLDNLNPMRLVSVFEMMLWYLCIPGVIWTLRQKRSVNVFATLIFSLFFLAVLSFVSPNVGSLYRIRFPFIFLLFLLGVLGWTELLYNRWPRWSFSKGSGRNEPPAPIKNAPADKLLSRTSVVGAGSIVIVLTILSYLGFFFRDIFMARLFGLGRELDAFYIGLMIPMFFVSVFSLPFGSALIPVFQKHRLEQSSEDLRSFVSSLSFALTLLLFILAVILFLGSPYILPVIGWNFSVLKLQAASRILYLFLPILVCSGALIIGNSLLNAMGKFFVPGAAQLIVPVVAIAFLFCFGPQYGASAVAWGMICGQLLNLLVVAIYLSRFEMSLLPRGRMKHKVAPSMLSQYLSLAAAAFFTSALIPIDNAMGSSLAEGSVATLSLGMKMVLFITGLINAGITSVMIPYFSAYMARNRLLEARRELSFFLAVVTITTIPIALMFYAFSGQLIELTLAGAALEPENLVTVDRVLRFGILQLPFFTCGLLVMRFITAHQKATLVMLASAVGLGANILLNFILMRLFGVAGISLATTISLALSAALLVLLMRHLAHISWFEVILLFLSWLMYLTLVVCISCENPTGTIITCVAFICLIIEQLKIYFRDRNKKLKLQWHTR